MTLSTTPWDSAAYLRNDDEIAAYLSAVLEEDDPALLTHALSVIACAKGMIQLAPEGHIELADVLRIVAALGLQLQATRRPIRHEEAA